MIQRIQSLYLVLVVILHILLWFLPIWSGSAPAAAEGNAVTAELSLSPTEFTGSDNLLPALAKYITWLNILNLLIILLSLICIFWFRTRLRQLKLSRFIVIMECLFIALVFWSIEDAKTALGAGYESNYIAGAFAPIVALILLFIAGQAIMRDERLVRSADRLR